MWISFQFSFDTFFRPQSTYNDIVYSTVLWIENNGFIITNGLSRVVGHAHVEFWVQHSIILLFSSNCHFLWQNEKKTWKSFTNCCEYWCLMRWTSKVNSGELIIQHNTWLTWWWKSLITCEGNIQMYKIMIRLFALDSDYAILCETNFNCLFREWCRRYSSRNDN